MEYKKRSTSEDLPGFLKKRITRRRAIAEGAKVGIAAGIGVVIGAIGGYLGGSAAVPPPVTTTKTETETVMRTETVTETAAARTVTTTVSPPPTTVTRTIERTVTVTGPAPPARPAVELIFSSPEWLPGRLTGEIAEGFPEYSQRELGYPVKVTMDFTPWPAYFERLSTQLAAKSPTPDLLISDSQWVGMFAEAGHIIPMNEYVEELGIDMKAFAPNLLRYYSVYPQWAMEFDEEGKYAGGPIYGFPHEGDNQLVAYRADLFENPEIRAAFKDEYGYELPDPAKNPMEWYDYTWFQWRDIAKFFKGLAGKSLGGVDFPEDWAGNALHFASAYDASADAWFMILINLGGQLWAGPGGGGPWFDPKDPPPGVTPFKVDGYINNEKGVEALELYKELYKLAPEGSQTAWFDEVNTYLIGGKIPMMVNWHGFLPALFDPKTNPKYYDKIKVAHTPGGPPDAGPNRHAVVVGGQPMCVSAYSKFKKECLVFIKYWFTREAQEKWALGGGGPCVEEIINSDLFLKARPQNQAYAKAVPNMVDVWNVPAALEMLVTLSIELNAYLTDSPGKKGKVFANAKECLDEIAELHEAALRKVGML